MTYPETVKLCNNIGHAVFIFFVLGLAFAGTTSMIVTVFQKFSFKDAARISWKVLTNKPLKKKKLMVFKPMKEEKE